MLIGLINLAVQSGTFIHETAVLVPSTYPGPIVILPRLTSHWLIMTSQTMLSVDLHERLQNYVNLKGDIKEGAGY